jgi:hypothetical protein
MESTTPWEELKRLDSSGVLKSIPSSRLGISSINPSKSYSNLFTYSNSHGDSSTSTITTDDKVEEIDTLHRSYGTWYATKKAVRVF